MIYILSIRLSSLTGNKFYNCFYKICKFEKKIRNEFDIHRNGTLFLIYIHINFFQEKALTDVIKSSLASQLPGPTDGAGDIVDDIDEHEL